VKEAARILIVDDDPEITRMLARSLSRLGYVVEATSSPEEAVSRSETTPFDAAVLDLVMPGRDGVDLAAALRSRTPGMPIALLTGYARSPLIKAAERQPGTAVFAKPVAIADLADFLQTEIR